MRKRILFLGPFLGLALFGMTLSGCVALAVGAAAGAGGYMWVKGQLVKEYPVPSEKLQRATLRALKNMGLAIVEQKGDRLAAKIESAFQDGKKIHIAVEAVTERSSRIKIRVGVFGDKMRSEMVLNAVEKNL